MRTDSKIRYNPFWFFMNIFFHLVHISIIFFFLFGWTSDRTIVAHFILSVLILISWCGLGYFYGFGYCLVTDIQWKIKRRMGDEPYTKYYIKYMVDKVTGQQTSAQIINRITTYSFFVILGISASQVMLKYMTS